MSEGIFFFAKNNWDAAFDNFKTGFVVLEEILCDVHPMAIALYLATLCSLTAKNAPAIADSLLMQTLELVNGNKDVPRCLVELFRNILETKEYLEVPLLCLRAATDALEETAPTQWKTLYVKERLCDALYHGQIHGEGADRRAQLFQTQRTKYGESRRNVLWTALNVADDHVKHGQTSEAEPIFLNVLELSEKHWGFHRAKIRVVALEGLARIASSRAIDLLGNL